jgi:hypothetical protein
VTRHLLLILSLGLVSTSVGELAWASSDAAEEGARRTRDQQNPRAAAAEARRDRKRALQSLVRIELDSGQAIVQVFKEGIDRKDIQLSEASTAAFDQSRELGKEARRFVDADETVEAYGKARESMVALAPVITEVLGQDKAPQPVVRLVEKQMETMTDRVKRVTPHLPAVGEDAAAAHESAKSLHNEAATLWADGQRKAGFQKFGEAVVALDKAIRLAIIEGPPRPPAAEDSAPAEVVK